jgi:hypothetical protein
MPGADKTAAETRLADPGATLRRPYGGANGAAAGREAALAAESAAPSEPRGHAPELGDSSASEESPNQPGGGIRDGAAASLKP